MSLKTYRLTQLTLMVALGAYLGARLLSGAIYYYINERFTALIVAGAILALGLAYGAWAGRRQPDAVAIDPDLPLALNPAEARARRGSGAPVRRSPRS